MTWIAEQRAGTVQHDRGYFMTEESEKAAKWDVVLEYRTASEHLVVLARQMQSIGEKMAAFGETIKKPENFSFDVEKQTITVGVPKSNPERPYARVAESDFNWADLCRLINDYQDTMQKKNQLAAQLRTAGLPLP
jgi:hypothetical protein